MKLLRDLVVCVIKVDYFMYDEKTDSEYTEPHYLAIDTEIKNKNGEPMNLLIFKKEITEKIRIFYSHKEAVQYIAEHSALRTPCYGENVRVVKIKYNFKENKWEEIINEK